VPFLSPFMRRLLVIPTARVLFARGGACPEGALASRRRRGVRIEESWPRFRPYRWLVERSSAEDPHRGVIQREISRVLVLNLSGKKNGAKNTDRTPPSLLSKGHPSHLPDLARISLHPVKSAETCHPPSKHDIYCLQEQTPPWRLHQNLPTVC